MRIIITIAETSANAPNTKSDCCQSSSTNTPPVSPTKVPNKDRIRRETNDQFSAMDQSLIDEMVIVFKFLIKSKLGSVYGFH